MGLVYKLKVQSKVLYSASLNDGFITFSFLLFNKKTETKLDINDIEIEDVSGPIGTTYKIKSNTLKHTLHKNYFLKKNEIQILKRRFDSYKKRYIKLEKTRKRELKTIGNGE